MKDLYLILGLPDTASTEQVKEAYRKLSKKFHPDLNDGDKFFEARFKEIQEAYEILGNAEKRRLYDNRRKGTVRQAEARQNTAQSQRPPQPPPPPRPAAASAAKPDDSGTNFVMHMIWFGVIAVVILAIAAATFSGADKKTVSAAAALSRSDTSTFAGRTFNIDPNAFDVYSNTLREVDLHLNLMRDTLTQPADSVTITQSEIKRRFDEDVEEVSAAYTEYYDNGLYLRASGSYNTDWSKKSYDEDRKNAKFVYTTDGRIIKKTIRTGDDDSTVLKFEYNGTDRGLSGVIIYNREGIRVAECSLSGVDETGAVIIAVYRTYGSDSYSRTAIDNFKIQLDSTGRVAGMSILYFSSYDRPAIDEMTYEEHGCMRTRTTYTTNTTTTSLPSFYSGSNDHQGYSLSSSTQYEYTFDERGNWTLRKDSNGHITRRKIYYAHKILSHRG